MISALVIVPSATGAKGRHEIVGLPSCAGNCPSHSICGAEELVMALTGSFQALRPTVSDRLARARALQSSQSMGRKMNKKESHKHDLARLFDEFFETGDEGRLKGYLVSNSNLPEPLAARTQFPICQLTGLLACDKI